MSERGRLGQESFFFGSKRRHRIAPIGLMVLALAVAGYTGAGCKHVSLSPYVSPRVEGRAVDAHSGEPIKNVEIKRIAANEELNVDSPAKGAQALMKSPGVRTSEDGKFALDSIRDLIVFRHTAWYSVTLSFRHPDYNWLMATYTPTNATVLADGEPVVHTGDVLLVPKTQ